jgi:hypothetical protein
MSEPITPHDLFRFHLSRFKRAFDIYARAQQGDPKHWKWYTEGQFENFIETNFVDTMYQASFQSPNKTNLYTRENYVKFSEMMYHIHVELPHVIRDLPQWQYLVTELHCRVLEREALAAAHPGCDVSAELKKMLCRMQCN